MSKKILITGGAGFVGSSIASYLKEDYPDAEIFIMDNLKRKGSELNVGRLTAKGITFIHGDIRNKEDFDTIPIVDFLIEASAEPSVMAGINSSPDYLINTNLVGTINCLNFAKKNNAFFVFLSTSRIYPIQGIENLQYEEKETRFVLAEQQIVSGVTKDGISEQFSLEGYRSLYGATKLASELIIQEYNHFYGIKSVINRCGVITGPWQMGKVDQGVVVLWVAKHFWNQKLSYIGYGGEGKQIRDILHVKDLYDLVVYQMNNMDLVNNKILNVGGGIEISVSLQELTKLCQEITGNTIEVSKIAENRSADIKLYITDNSQVTTLTGWRPKISAKQIVQEIYDWIVENEAQLESILK